MALEKITMPQLGESVTEGTISAWLVKPGDTVKKYESLAEVQTDKVTAEIPSSYTGVVKQLIAEEGQTLAVGELICMIETELSPEIAGNNNESLHDSAGHDEAIGDREFLQQQNKQRYSPAVLHMSQQYQIDLNRVTGTGKGGRITRKDLQKLIESGNIPSIQETENESRSVQTPIEQSIPFSTVQQSTVKDQANTATPKKIGEFDLEIPVTAVRKAIATNMLRSKQEVPHAWTMIEVDVTNLVAYRDSVKAEFKEKEGFPLTYFAFFVKAVAQALKEFPMVNSLWAGDKIIQKKAINLSIAVATDDALYVPVIKNADEKTIKGIAREIAELAQKVRNGKLSVADMEGGTFTVNNTGSFGSVQSMGIINYPQAAILQVEAIVKRPVVIHDNMIAIRDIVNLCMSLDHRILDGLIAGRFLQRVKELLESMSKENTSIY